MPKFLSASCRPWDMPRVCFVCIWDPTQEFKQMSSISIWRISKFCLNLSRCTYKLNWSNLNLWLPGSSVNWAHALFEQEIISWNTKKTGKWRMFETIKTIVDWNNWSQKWTQIQTQTAKTFRSCECLVTKRECQGWVGGRSRQSKNRALATCVTIGPTLCTFGMKRSACTTIKTSLALRMIQKHS